MGRGTISFVSVPPKRKLYGDKDFFLFPIHQEGDEYFFILRPSQDKEYLFELEGEWNCGEDCFNNEKRRVMSRHYKNTKFFYLESDLEDMTFKQKKRILNWAIDGEL